MYTLSTSFIELHLKMTKLETVAVALRCKLKCARRGTSHSVI